MRGPISDADRQTHAIAAAHASIVAGWRTAHLRILLSC